MVFLEGDGGTQRQPPGDPPAPVGGGSGGSSSSTAAAAATGSGSGSTGAASGANISEPYDSRKMTGFVGLVNMGTTCYLNCLLQLLFHLSYFRSAVYKISERDPGSSGGSPAREGHQEQQHASSPARKASAIPAALQELFYQMQERMTAPEPRMLTNAFQWCDRDLVVQHDIQELATLLRDNLEGKMKGTPAEGAIRRLFEGVGEKVIETVDRTYVSRNRDIFYDIHLPLGKQFPTLYDSMRSLTAKEQLNGDNKYKVEEEGKPAVFKDAEMGYRFIKFPPVIFFHLKRFEMDMYSPTLEMKKVNTSMEFFTELDLREFEAGQHSSHSGAGSSNEGFEAGGDGESFTTDSQAIYDLHGVIVHRGTARVGHYYCYIRKYNTDTQRFEDWYEFDDDTVRVVREEDAVSDNFGGFRYHTVNGYSQPFPKTHNAYILSYVRRGDCEKLMRPTPTSLIPPHIIEKFKAVMVEDEQRRREEEVRNRSCTLTIYTDEHIAATTHRNTFELITKDTASILEPIIITVKKVEPLMNVFKQLEQLGHGSADSVRLWTWHFMLENRRGYRPGAPLPKYDDLATSQTVADMFVALQLVREDELPRPWRQTFYLERRRPFIPPLVTNLTYLGLQSVSHTTLYSDCPHGAQGAVTDGPPIRLLQQDGVMPQLQLKFKRALPISFVLVRIHHPKNRDIRMTVGCSLFGVDSDAAVASLTITRQTSYERETCLVFKFNTVEAVDRVAVYRIECVPRHEAFGVSRVHAHVAPHVIPECQTPLAPRQVFAPVDQTERISLFIKFYNHKLGAVSYLGMVVARPADPLQNVYPAIYDLLGLAKEEQRREFPLLCCDESIPFPVGILDPHLSCSHSENNLQHGNIVVVQLDPARIPLVYRHPRFDYFAAFLRDRISVTVRNVAHPEVIAGVLTMQNSWQHASVVEWIGEKLGLDAERLRLWGNSDFATPTPKELPERSDSGRTLRDMLQISQWTTQELFYEVLETKLKQVECMTYLDARLNSSLGTDPGELISMKLDASATVQDVVERVLAENSQDFDEPYALLLIVHSLIYAHAEVTPASDPVVLASLIPTDERFIAEVRPFTPTPAGHLLLCCGHCDNRNKHFTVDSTFGSPFLCHFPQTATPHDAKRIFMQLFDLKETDLVEPETKGVMMQTRQLLYFPNWDLKLKCYLETTENTSRHPSHFMINHKQPNAQPGSRYVASSDPKLVLEKGGPM